MQQMMLVSGLKFIPTIVFIMAVVSGCGGGGGGSSQPSNSVSQKTSDAINTGVSSSSSSSVSSIADTVTLSGTITYDYVPHNANHIGLNYSAIESRPVRGAVVELLDDTGQVKATTNTTGDGAYLFTLQKNTTVKLRVKAQLLSKISPTWDFKITDNTSNNALYVLDGSLVSVGTQNSKRDLHADSGWDGAGYSAPRAAAPFAILDDIYVGTSRVLAAGNKKNLSPLELRWSPKNSAADGDASRGEIGTSYYDGSAIYILGDANNDTDEYDSHVLLHEWGHYLESELFRSDSIGGDHSDGALLDFRVAMSEGFANAFSGMMNNDINYADSSGVAQASGFSFSIGRKTRINKGFFSEGSVGSVLYNYYANGAGKMANDFTPIFNVLSSPSYKENEALTSIFLFSSQFKNQIPEHASLFNDLLQEQNIFGSDEYGADESNNGGLSIVLPVYKTLTMGNLAVNVCSAADFGKQNKLGNSQFLKLNINQSGSYNIRINKSGGADVISKPEVVVYQKGKQLAYLPNSVADNVSGNIGLLKGNYIVEVYDFNNHDRQNRNNNTTCFNVRIAAN